MSEKTVHFNDHDFIMDSNIFQEIELFLEQSNDSKEVIESLSKSYRGYAQMVSLLSFWMKQGGFTEEQIDEIIMEQFETEIKKDFNSKKVDEIFNKFEKEPEWIESLILKKGWRKIIYELSELYPDCLFLNYCIQRVSEIGFLNEITHVTACSSRFKVFHSVLVNILNQLVLLDEESLLESKLFLDFQKICCHNEYSFVYSQFLIRSLTKIENGEVFKRFSETIELNALSKNEPIVRKIGLLYSKYDSLKDGVNSNEIFKSLLNIFKEKQTNLEDITNIYNAYTKTKLPPLDFIQNPKFFDLLINDLFNPGKQLQDRDKYIFLLAISVSEPEDLESTIEAITISSEICKNNDNMKKTILKLRKQIKYKVVCIGIVQWISYIMSELEFFISVYNISSGKLIMELLKEITYYHSTHHSLIFDLLSLLFKSSHYLDSLDVIEMKKLYLDVMIFMIQIGYVLPCLNLFESLIPSLEYGLLKHFLDQIFGMVESPFSDEFRQSMLKILSHQRVKDALKYSIDKFMDQIKGFY